MPQINEYINIFFTLLAIVDPLGAVPIFLSLAPSSSKAFRFKIAWLTFLAVGITLIFSALLGDQVLNILGISIDSFRIAGGILLLILGIPMLQGNDRATAPQHLNTKNPSMAVVPLAIPLLAGPGAISSMTIYAHRYTTFEQTMILIAISLLVALLSGLTLLLASVISKFLGKTGIQITIRLMGLILSAAAIQFIVNGLRQLFPGLTS